MKSIKAKKLTFALAFISNIAIAQNLVPNSGFENYTACPPSPGALWLAFPWDTLNANPDLFHACNLNSNNCASVNVPNNFAGNAAAHSGTGYAGFIAYQNSNNREYLQTSLASPLLPGKIYKVQAWLRISSYSQFAVQTIGLTLSIGALTQNGTSFLGFPPQVETAVTVTDTSTWTLLQGFIIAAGGENNITIGNFRDDASSGIIPFTNAAAQCPLNAAYYYVDDVKLELINEQIYITGDSIICPGNSTTLYAHSNTITWWSLSNDPSTPISTSPTITINPTVNTTYILNGIFYRDSITVYIIPPPVVELGNDTTICEENFVPLDVTNSNSTYTWSTGETSPSIIAGQNQLYWVEVDNGGCTATDSIKISVLTNLPVNLGSDTIYCSLHNDYITLNAGIGTSYLWLPGSETTQSIVVNQPGTYSVIVNHQNGCTKDTSISIQEICEPEIFIPSSFTPNNDGINDILLIAGNSFESFQLQVYNRWGSLVFETNNPARGWDGAINDNPSPMGVYAWFLNYSGRDKHGNAISGMKSGTITLIR